MFISQIKKFKKCKDIEDMWFLLLPYFCRFNILLYFHVYQQLRKIIQNWSGRETIARKSEWVSRVCTQKNWLWTHSLRIVYCCPFCHLGDLNERAHEKTQQILQNGNFLFSKYLRYQTPNVNILHYLSINWTYIQLKYI